MSAQWVPSHLGLEGNEQVGRQTGSKGSQTITRVCDEIQRGHRDLSWAQKRCSTQMPVRLMTQGVHNCLILKEEELWPPFKRPRQQSALLTQPVVDTFDSQLANSGNIRNRLARREGIR